MDLTQQQIDVLGQNLRKKHLRIELLDFDMKTVDSLEGVAIGGEISVDATNAIRRSGNIEMAIPLNANATTFLDKLSGLVIDVGGKIWLDKYVKIYIGIEDTNSDDAIVWYKLGVFLIDEPRRNFSATDFSITFQCVDLMAKLTGSRQGQLTGQTTMIEKGYYVTSGDSTIYVRTKLADALISTITELGGFSKYSIFPIPETYEYLPYDIKVGVGATVYDILKNLMDIISTWQMYFDLDGVFVVQPIPSGASGIVYPLTKGQYIAAPHDYDFQNVKNQVVVYGRVNNLNYYTENTQSEQSNVVYENNGDGTYSLVLKYTAIDSDSVAVLSTNFGFLSLDVPNMLPITQVKIYNNGTLWLTAPLVKFENSTKSFGQVYQTTQIEAKTILQKDVCFIRINSASLNDDQTIDFTQEVIFEFMGKQSVSYCLVNDNKESPFYINGSLPKPNYYAGLATTPDNAVWGSVFELTLNNDEAITSLSEGTIITFMANGLNIYAQGETSTKINILSADGTTLLSNVSLVQNTWDTSTIPATRPPVSENKLYNDYTIWEIRYEMVNNVAQFVLLGRSPTVLVKVLSGGEYDNIYADQLAYERSLWELFNYSNLNDNISLEVVPNYIIDVNCKIKFNDSDATPRGLYTDEELAQEESKYYITKKVNYPLGVGNNPQSIYATRIYDSGNLVGEDN